MNVQQTPFSLRTCQRNRAAKHTSSRCPSNFFLGTVMLIFDTCLRFTRKYKYVNVQKINSNLKSI